MGGIKFIFMVKRDFAIHLITLQCIQEYMRIAIINTEAADCVKISICAILKTFDHNCLFTVGEFLRMLYYHAISDRGHYMSARNRD
ncbi:hypothetical protein UPYG_G00268790 [Umbra pygmaea]|uniref:Uncharacterized protein n=1 Tax=Umbra pygmaea TaxID=75934 RepID=A0ABD0X0U1_UMBPY